MSVKKRALDACYYDEVEGRKRSRIKFTPRRRGPAVIRFPLDPKKALVL